MANEKRNFSQDEEGAEQREVGEVKDLESISKALEEEREKAEKYLASWQRSEADFINFKRRNEQERAEMAGFANVSLILELLPILDDLERALESVSDEGDAPTWVDGFRLIYRKMKTVLEGRGLSEIEAVGRDFDPNIHEAVMCVDGEEGKVCEQIQKGYKIRDRVIRPTMVKVGKEEESSESE